MKFMRSNAKEAPKKNLSVKVRENSKNKESAALLLVCMIMTKNMSELHFPPLFR